MVNMPRKSKPRKPVASSDEVWIAPRPANSTELRTFEPAGVVRSNRYLEFADIALGVAKASRPGKKARRTASNAGHDQHPDSKVTPINQPRGPHFGAFRNPR